jgi:protein phosphatase
MPTSLRAGVVTDVGRARQVNQDTPLVADQFQLWAVADGMGGHAGGEIASELAVNTLRDVYGERGERSLDALLDAVASANSAVNGTAIDDPGLRGMGTTLVAIARTEEDELAYISVGDSRIYLLRDGDLSRLTVDHSLVEELVREGSITPEEARSHPKRNVVTRAIGIDTFVQVDSATIIPYTGDRFLLCSDGLFNEVEHDRIASVLRRLADPTDAAAELVRLANEAGGRDNITVLVVDVVDDDDRAGKASAIVDASPRDDMAGFTVIRATDDSPVPTADDGGPRSRADQRQARKEAKRQARGERPRRFTWRVALFLLLLVGILVTGIAAIGYYARGTYFVGFDGDVVTVFQGKPGGVLWFDPTVVEHTEFTRADVRPELVDELESGVELPDEARAIAFPLTVVTTTTSTTSTTSTTTTSTTTPVLPPP